MTDCVNVLSLSNSVSQQGRRRGKKKKRQFFPFKWLSFGSTGEPVGQRTVLGMITKSGQNQKVLVCSFSPSLPVKEPFVIVHRQHGPRHRSGGVGDGWQMVPQDQKLLLADGRDYLSNKDTFGYQCEELERKNKATFPRCQLVYRKGAGRMETEKRQSIRSCKKSAETFQSFVKRAPLGRGGDLNLVSYGKALQRSSKPALLTEYLDTLTLFLLLKNYIFKTLFIKKCNPFFPFYKLLKPLYGCLYFPGFIVCGKIGGLHCRDQEWFWIVNLKGPLAMFGMLK